MRMALPVAAALLLASPMAVRAATFSIFPVRIDLSEREPVQTMTVQNGSDTSTRVQVRIRAWRQENGQDVFEETRDVLVNPAMFEIGPGEQQIARFGMRTKAAAVEKSYRIFLEEVPSSAPRAPGQIQTLLRISVPMFVPAEQAAPAKLNWSLWPSGAHQVTLSVRNDGASHAHLSGLSLMSRDGHVLGKQGRAVYILPGATQPVLIDVKTPVAAGERLKLSASSDQSSLSAEIISQAGPHDSRP
ncbi:fimbria/pilus periplasmic chaperone [Sphingobium sp. H39-3-25]|uniref:fimbrial biogenesis chaperone n=1 Tax=Sphingobium arseniciresistens TaxID=3030834 RepID=UPI0023B9855C|nr:fimbria/pilus periplasmic chaperone [Sphingobium arseniciresistens]